MVVDLTVRHGNHEARVGEGARGLHGQRHLTGPDDRGDRRASSSRSTCTTRTSPSGIALHWHGVDVPNAEDGVAGITQNAIKAGKDYTYRWVAPHAGTFWYHSHQVSHEQVSQGPARCDRDPPAHARTRRLLETLALAHLYDGDETVNGRTGDQRVVAPPGQRVRIRAINTDNGPQPIWTSRPLPAAGDRRVRRQPADRGLRPVRGDPRRWSRRPRGDRAPGRSAVGVQLGDSRLVVGPEGSKAPEVEQPDKRLDLLHYGAPTAVPFDTHPRRPGLPVLHRSQARLHRREAGLLVEHQRPPLPRHADDDRA